MYLEDTSGLDDDWFYDSIQRYEDLLIYEFQGKVSSGCFMNEEKLVATCQNLNGGNEILNLVLPDRLFPIQDSGPSRNRDFRVLSAGYSISKPCKIISYENFLVTSEENGVCVYKIPDSRFSDMIKPLLMLRETKTLPQICLCHGDNSIISGSNLNEIKNHCLISGKEMKKLHINFDPNLGDPKTMILSKLYNRANDLILGLKEIGVILMVDLRSQQCRSIQLSAKNGSKQWTSATSLNGTKTALMNCEGEIFIFDSRNNAKESLKLESQYTDCENGNYLSCHFDPTQEFLSVSGFAKHVQVFSLEQSTERNLPNFIHDGHFKSASVCGHIWHPTLSSLVFSFDDNSILQAWKFKA